MERDDEADKAGPELSVVIVMGDPLTREGLKRTLQGLLNQCALDMMEIVLIDCSEPETEPIPGSDHPVVRTIQLVRENTTMTEARAVGVQQARAPIVAFQDEHSFPLAGWAEAIVKAHKGPWAAVGGEIYNLDSAVGFADPIYLMGHGRWAPPAPRGEVDLLASHDTSYKREALLQYGSDLPLLLMGEPVLMWKLREDGHKLFLEPDVKSMHGYTVNPLTLVAFYAWNRGFAYARAKVFHWSWKRRVLQALAAPVLPLIRSAQLFRLLWRRRKSRLPTFLVGLPLILLAQYSAALGEAVGALFNLGSAHILFTQTHLRGLRVFPELPESWDRRGDYIGSQDVRT